MASQVKAQAKLKPKPAQVSLRPAAGRRAQHSSLIMVIMAMKKLPRQSAKAREDTRTGITTRLVDTLLSQREYLRTVYDSIDSKEQRKDLLNILRIYTKNYLNIKRRRGH